MPHMNVKIFDHYLIKNNIQNLILNCVKPQRIGKMNWVQILNTFFWQRLLLFNNDIINIRNKIRLILNINIIN